MRRTKIRGDKGYHTALITIKQGDQHSGPNRNSKHNQIETKIYYSFRHVDVLTRIAKKKVITIRDVEVEAEAEVVKAALFLWKRKRKQKREDSTASAST